MLNIEVIFLLLALFLFFFFAGVKGLDIFKNTKVSVTLFPLRCEANISVWRV